MAETRLTVEARTPLSMDLQPNTEKVRRLAEEHIRRYAKMLLAAAQGAPGYRREELRELLKLWRSVRSKGCDWSQLSAEERSEVCDALDDEA